MPVVDPFLDSINDMLMEEGMEDATCSQEDGDVSYQAILCSFYDIIGEPPPPKAHIVSSKQHVMGYNGFNMLTHKMLNSGAFRVTLSANGNAPSTFFQEEGADTSLVVPGLAQHFVCPNSATLNALSTQDSHAVIKFNDGELMDAKVSCWERDKALNNLTHQMLNSEAFRVTLPANGNVPSSFFLKERADISLVVPQHVISPNSANLTALSTQDSHAAIKFGDEELMDTKGSCWEKDMALNNLRSCSGRGSNVHFQLPSPYKESSLKLAGVELLFEDLKLHDHYVDLYVGEPDIPAEAPKYGSKEKSLAVAGKRGKAGKKRTADVHEYVDLKGMIVNCAQAVAVGDVRAANELLQQIKQVHGASADGSGSQRAAHYFSEALVARMRGTGGHLFRAIQHQKPPVVTILKSYMLMFEISPFVKVIHYFANQSILKAAERASRLHILDYGLEYGIQWPCLINALADQKGGPPLLVITGIGFPRPGNNPTEMLEESGRRLAAHARNYKVPFQFHAIASSKWEDLDSSSFLFHEDEVLVVNCVRRLCNLADESVDLISPRQKLFTSIHSLKPHLLITADVSAAHNSPFVSRFREALYYFSSMFDILDTLRGDNPERLLKENIFYYSDIVNIVACEGAERVERAETYKQWELRIKRAGFEQLLISPVILSRSRSHVKQHYHKDFFVHDHANKWMLLGWKGRTSMAISAWKLSDAQLSLKGDAP